MCTSMGRSQGRPRLRRRKRLDPPGQRPQPRGRRLLQLRARGPERRPDPRGTQVARFSASAALLPESASKHDEPLMWLRFHLCRNVGRTRSSYGCNVFFLLLVFRIAPREASREKSSRGQRQHQSYLCGREERNGLHSWKTELSSDRSRQLDRVIRRKDENIARQSVP